MDHSIFFVVDLDKFSEPAGVVVVYSLSIAKGLKKNKTF